MTYSTPLEPGSVWTDRNGRRLVVESESFRWSTRTVHLKPAPGQKGRRTEISKDRFLRTFAPASHD